MRRLIKKWLGYRLMRQLLPIVLPELIKVYGDKLRERELVITGIADKAVWLAAETAFQFHKNVENQ